MVFLELSRSGFRHPPLLTPESTAGESRPYMAAESSMSTAYTTNISLKAVTSLTPKRGTKTAGAAAPIVPASRAARSPMPASAKRSVRCSAVVVSGSAACSSGCTGPLGPLPEMAMLPTKKETNASSVYCSVNA